jgi:pilus assembly protein Flp/PilA
MIRNNNKIRHRTQRQQDPAMLLTLKRFMNDERGSTAIEYALIGVLISVFIIGAVTGAGDRVHDLFSKVDTTLSTAIAKVGV